MAYYVYSSTQLRLLADMIEAKGSSRHPLGQLAYRIISGNVWYDARVVLEDQKV